MLKGVKNYLNIKYYSLIIKNNLPTKFYTWYNY